LQAIIPTYSYRHLVRPGITGWAQIHCGYAATVEESLRKLSYDLFYVGRHGLLIDLEILLRTGFVMLAGIGAR
jgi:lipopolysaccharide/colanic/teichoic acid biosynthesis glycosyltransferase